MQPVDAPPGMQWMPPQPIPGMKIKPPLVAPAPGQVVVAYQTCEPQVGCCQCGTLNTTGLISMIVLILMFWPLAFIPCVQADCHEQYQRPVYGNPGMPAPTAYPTAKPV